MFVPERTRFATLLPEGIGDLFAASILAYLFWVRHGDGERPSRPLSVSGTLLILEKNI